MPADKHEIQDTKYFFIYTPSTSNTFQYGEYLTKCTKYSFALFTTTDLYLQQINISAKPVLKTENRTKDEHVQPSFSTLQLITFHISREGYKLHIFSSYNGLHVPFNPSRKYRTSLQL